MRNEFIGLKLVDVLKEIRSAASAASGGSASDGLDCDLQVQIDVFDEQG